MNRLKCDSPYKASLTREQFCFYEMRTTAKLMQKRLSEQEIIQNVIENNLFQYPTEKSLKRIAEMCIKRLKSMNDEILVSAIAYQPVEIAKQVCLYAMMKHSQLVWDFMLTVIAEKYRQQDFSFSKMDLNVFFMRLQEQDDGVATWSDSTITKIKQILVKLLVDNKYLDNNKSTRLNPVMICSLLENSIRFNGDEAVLPAFNCFI